MADLQPTDEFLVNRDDTTYTQQQDTLMANLETTDYLLVNRSDATFKITGEDLINSVIDPLEIDAVLINPNLNIGDIAAVQVSLLGGKAPFSYVYQWKSTDADDNKTDIVGATASTYGIQEQDLGNRLSCEVTVTDSLDSEDTDETDLSNPVTAVEAVTKPTLIAPPDGAGLSDQTRASVFAESGAIQSVTQEGFAAVMDGLRFTPQRDTTMMSSAESFGGTFTLSLWIKPGAGGFDGTYDQNQYLFSNADPGTVGFNLASAEGSNILRFWNTSKHEVLSPDPLPEYTWSHVVITADHPKAELICYVNGVKKNTVNQSIEQQRAKIGVFDGIGSTIDGYASEWYFVDGQVLEPTDFGTDDDGVWGPLDRSVILANIQAGEPSPYDQRPNMDEEWSAGAKTGGAMEASGGWDQAFTGSITSAFYAQSQGGNSVLTFTNPISFTTLRFSTGTTGLDSIKFNGVLQTITHSESFTLVDVVGVSSPLTTVEIVSAGGNLAAIEVDGRILVDGPANNSENWSDRTSQSGTGWVGGRPISNIYSGELHNDGPNYMPGVNNGSGTVVFDPPITGSLIELNGSSSSNVITINSGGTLALTDNSFSGTIWNDTGVTSLSQLDLVGSGSFATYIRAIRVDGELLVDSGAQWNTSEVWSSGVEEGNAYDTTTTWDKAFNGDNANGASGTAPSDYKITLPASVPITNSSTVVVNLLSGAAAAFKINDVYMSTYDEVNTFAGSEISGNSIVSLAVNNGCTITSISVDGKLLVDAASFGANGFYLPFDASATGVNYSQHLSNASNPENAFKGNSDPSTALGVGSISPAGQTWLWQPVGLNGMTSLKIWSGTGGARDNGNIILNGADTGISSSGGLAERDLTAYITANNITTLTRLEINNTTSEPVSLLAVEYNGSVLVDHNNIGVDASGNNNNFHDNNFAVGNTSQVWSNGGSDSDLHSGSWRNAFNGETGSHATVAEWTAYAYGSDAAYTFPTPVSGKLGFLMSGGASVARLGRITLSDGQNLEVTNTTDTATWVYADVTNLTGFTLMDDSVPDGTALNQVSLDGELLVDANIQDTVKDTPMTNYSTFKSNATDGNLIPTADGGNVSYKGESGTQYYYEKDGVGVIHEGGVSIAAETGVVYNFGQMSFAADNVTDNGDGTVTVDGVVYGTLFEELTSTATLTLADEGTLGLIPDGATPRMNATGNGAEGSYKSHTSTELVMNNIVGSWTTDSLTAKSVTEYSPAAPNPDDFTMVSSAYDATPEETALHGSTIWQVSDDPGFSAPVINEDTDVYLESFDTGGLQPETIYYGRVKHITVNGTSSPWSDVNTFKTATGEDPEPEAAKMSGLRFDDSRATTLTKTFGQSSTAGTVSVWIKVTDYGSYGYIWKTSNDLGLYIDTSSGTYNGKLAISASHYASGSPGTAYSTDTIPLNEWVNVVFRTGDGTNTAGMWINGVSQDNSTIDWTTGGFAITDGFTRIGEDNGGNYFNGYMSDFYLVDGQSLEPTAFGEDIDGRWAPLGNNTIINNITRNESPYDQRPDMSVKWSDSSDWGPDAFKNQPFGGGSYSNSASGGVVIQATFTGVSLIEFSANVTIAPVTIEIDDAVVPHTYVNTGGDNYIITVDSGIPASFSKLAARTANGNSFGLYGTRIDGRILVDGPADNSQNWSSYVSPGGGFDVQEPANAFNGSFDGLGWGGDSGVEYLMTIPGGIPCSSIRLYINSGGDYSPSDFLINGSQSINSSVGGTLQWTPATTVNGGTLNTIRFPVRKNNSDGWTVWAIEVDGAILVDSGAQWDTSQIWSDSWPDPTIITPGRVPEKMFDGLLNSSNIYQGVDSGQTVVWTLPMTGVTSLKVRFESYPGEIKVNGGATQSIPLGSLQTINLGAASVDNPAISVTGTSNRSFYISGWEVNGKILVDPGSFGANGFYLPFDPEAVGMSYTANTTITGTYEGNNKGTTVPFDPEWLWDGNVVAGIHTGIFTTSNFTLTFANAIDIDGVWINTGGGGWDVTTDNGTISVGDLTGQVVYVSLEAASGLTSSISVSSGSGNASIFGFVKNGKVLVDHSSIGVDDSGNDNHFYDKNFAVGNTSQFWSGSTTLSGDLNATYNNPAALFDGILIGDKGDGRVIGTPQGTMNIKFGQVLSGKIDFWLRSGDATDTFRYSIDGSAPTIAVNNLQTGAGGWVSLGDITINTNNGISWKNDNGGNSVIICGIRVNGKLLIDANIQDTVKDTPMTNYAVWSNTGATNGNLSFAAAGGTNNAYTQIPVSPAPYYSEVSVDTATDTSTNFVGIGYVRATDAPNNTSNAAPFDGIQVLIYSDAIYLFEDDSATQTQTVTGDFPVGTIVGLTLENASSDSPTGALYVNGAQVATYTLKSSFSTVYGCSRTNVSQGTTNFGQQPFAGSNVTDNGDGTVTIDGVVYNTLFQDFRESAEGFGYFYDAVNEKPVRGTTIADKYGLFRAEPRLGIYDLTEVPNYQVAGYERSGNQYQPIRSLAPELKASQAETAAAQAETVAAEAQADQYLNYLRAAACMWVVDKVYEAGDIINFNGQLYRATINAVATANTDPGDGTDRWEALNITAN